MNIHTYIHTYMHTYTSSVQYLIQSTRTTWPGSCPPSVRSGWSVFGGRPTRSLRSQNSWCSGASTSPRRRRAAGEIRSETTVMTLYVSMYVCMYYVNKILKQKIDTCMYMSMYVLRKYDSLTTNEQYMKFQYVCVHEHDLCVYAQTVCVHACCMYVSRVCIYVCMYVWDTYSGSEGVDSRCVVISSDHMENLPLIVLRLHTYIHTYIHYIPILNSQ